MYQPMKLKECQNTNSSKTDAIQANTFCYKASEKNYVALNSHYVELYHNVHLKISSKLCCHLGWCCLSCL